MHNVMRCSELATMHLNQGRRSYIVRSSEYPAIGVRKYRCSPNKSTSFDFVVICAVQDLFIYSSCCIKHVHAMCERSSLNIGVFRTTEALKILWLRDMDEIIATYSLGFVSQSPPISARADSGYYKFRMPNFLAQR